MFIFNFYVIFGEAKKEMIFSSLKKYGKIGETWSNIDGMEYSMPHIEEEFHLETSTEDV